MKKKLKTELVKIQSSFLTNIQSCILEAIQKGILQESSNKHKQILENAFKSHINGKEYPKKQKRPAEKQSESGNNEEGVMSTDIEQEMQESESEDDDPLFQTVEKRQLKIRKSKNKETDWRLVTNDKKQKANRKKKKVDN